MMNNLSAEFITSATRPSQYPPVNFPEIAFAGKSNVGKSSLINVLVNRKRLVKTSTTPGRTQLINFFDINGSMTFVDLPGYGYAKVPASIKKSWKPMIETYLSGRPTLKAVVLIMDIRRIPDEKDLYLINWLAHYQIPTIPILTKTDKLKTSQQARQLTLASAATGIPKDQFILFSAKTRTGKEQIWEAIERKCHAATL
jgi:GTP-binding protein